MGVCGQCQLGGADAAAGGEGAVGGVVAARGCEEQGQRHFLRDGGAGGSDRRLGRRRLAPHQITSHHCNCNCNCNCNDDDWLLSTTGSLLTQIVYYFQIARISCNAERSTAVITALVQIGSSWMICLISSVAATSMGSLPALFCTSSLAP